MYDTNIKKKEALGLYMPRIIIIEIMITIVVTALMHNIVLV